MHAGHDLSQIASSLLDASEHTAQDEDDQKEDNSHLPALKELLLQIIGDSDSSAQRPDAQTLCVDTTRPPGWLLPGFPSGSELAVAPRQPVSEQSTVRLGKLARALLESKATLALPAGGTQEEASADMQVRSPKVTSF